MADGTNRLPEALFAARTLQALELLALQPLSAPQVAEALAVDPRTARRLLNRLAADGWLVRGDDPRRVYAPTLRIASLAGHVLQRDRVVHAALPFVTTLSAELGGDAHLAVPSYRSVLGVVHASAGRPARVALGALAPCHATATGKALLAHRPAWRESVLAAPLERCTARTITDPDALRAVVEEVRRRGYAVEHGESHAGVRAVAAPVFTPAGEAIAALGAVVGGEALPAAVAALVVERANRLTASLRGEPAAGSGPEAWVERARQGRPASLRRAQ